MKESALAIVGLNTDPAALPVYSPCGLFSSVYSSPQVEYMRALQVRIPRAADQGCFGVVADTINPNMAGMVFVSGICLCLVQTPNAEPLVDVSPGCTYLLGSPQGTAQILWEDGGPSASTHLALIRFPVAANAGNVGLIQNWTYVSQQTPNTPGPNNPTGSGGGAINMQNDNNNNWAPSANGIFGFAQLAQPMPLAGNQRLMLFHNYMGYGINAWLAFNWSLAQGYSYGSVQCSLQTKITPILAPFDLTTLTFSNSGGLSLGIGAIIQNAGSDTQYVVPATVSGYLYSPLFQASLNADAVLFPSQAANGGNVMVYGFMYQVMGYFNLQAIGMAAPTNFLANGYVNFGDLSRLGNSNAVVVQ
jgi:hypothetical protein